jgi:hypothetical protein
MTGPSATSPSASAERRPLAGLHSDPGTPRGFPRVAGLPRHDQAPSAIPLSAGTLSRPAVGPDRSSCPYTAVLIRDVGDCAPLVSVHAAPSGS